MVNTHSFLVILGVWVRLWYRNMGCQSGFQMWLSENYGTQNLMADHCFFRYIYNIDGHVLGVNPPALDKTKHHPGDMLVLCWIYAGYTVICWFIPLYPQQNSSFCSVKIPHHIQALETPRIWLDEAGGCSAPSEKQHGTPSPGTQKRFRTSEKIILDGGSSWCFALLQWDVLVIFCSDGPGQSFIRFQSSQQGGSTNRRSCRQSSWVPRRWHGLILNWENCARKFSEYLRSTFSRTSVGWPQVNSILVS